MWRNSKVLFLPEACADDAVQNNDERLTTKPSNSENNNPEQRTDSLNVIDNFETCYKNQTAD